MTKAEAQQLLESARAGARVSEARITEALICTGDIVEREYPLHVIRQAGSWERRGISEHMAAADAFDGLFA